MTRCETSKPRCALIPQPSSPTNLRSFSLIHPIYPHVPLFFPSGKTKNHNKNRSEKRALKCSAAACASSMLGGSSPTVRSLRLGWARTKSASSAPRQKARTMPPTRHRYYPLRPVRQRRCHGCIVPSARQSPMVRKRAKHRPRCVSFPPRPTTIHDLTARRRTAHASPPARTMYIYMCVYHTGDANQASTWL